MKKKITKRTLTSKGLLLEFEDGTHCLLQAEKLAVIKVLGIAVPNVGTEVTVEESIDAAGNISAEWFNLAV